MSSADDAADKNPLTRQPWWPMVAIVLGFFGISSLRGPTPAGGPAGTDHVTPTQLAPTAQAAKLKGVGNLRLLSPLIDFLSEKGFEEPAPAAPTCEQLCAALLARLHENREAKSCALWPLSDPTKARFTDLLCRSFLDAVGWPQCSAFEFLTPIVRATSPQSSQLPDPAVHRPAIPATHYSDSRTQPRYTVDTMIVDVPDPIESTVGYQFDVVVETFEQAMLREGFVPDRYYLPWREYRSRISADPKRAADRDERIHLKEPGVLLFRGVNKEGGDQGQLLLVFLIGESPLLGIHRNAFNAAAETIRSSLPKLQREKPELGFECKRSHSIQILAPYFSGGAETLALAISSASDRDKLRGTPTPVFRVVSGSAENVDKERFETMCGGPDRALFQSTSILKDLIENELVAYVADRSWNGTPPKTAWLTESNTAFGKPSTAKLPSQEPATQQSQRRVDFPFPIHISRVRAAFSSARNAAKQSAPVFDFSRYKLSIPFEDAEEPNDIIPQFAPGLTAPTVELLLARVLTAIKQGRFDCVGITATDPRDTIFLSGLLREYCPDAQLLIAGSDPLFTHPDARTFLRGALVGSAYPVTLAGQRTQRDDDNVHREFASDECQGLYNAALILRNYMAFDANADHRELRAGADSSDVSEQRQSLPPLIGYYPYRDDEAIKDGQSITSGPVPGRKCQPQIWITVIGNDGFWPMSNRSIKDAATDTFDKLFQNPQLPRNYTFTSWTSIPPDQSESQVLQDSVQLQTHFDPITRTLFILVLTFAFFEIIAYLRGKLFWSNGLCRGRDGKSEPPYGELAWRNLLYRVAPLLAVASLTWYLAAIRVVDLDRTQSTSLEPLGWLSLGLIVLGVLGILWAFSSAGLARALMIVVAILPLGGAVSRLYSENIVRASGEQPIAVVLDDFIFVWGVTAVAGLIYVVFDATFFLVPEYTFHRLTQLAWVRSKRTIAILATACSAGVFCG
jgi:hypothetical protein